MATKINVVLRPVKSIVVRFCPFESNVESTRKFLECISRKKIQATNRNCEVTADVRHDGSEPLVDVMFGKEFFLNPYQKKLPSLCFYSVTVSFMILFAVVSFFWFWSTPKCAAGRKKGRGSC
uniref:Large ribosomal subunit protein mL53 n=1 Tax=Cairina moschata TaxID=8855 RepID=A0A8C3GEC6_CAIMO